MPQTVMGVSNEKNLEQKVIDCFEKVKLNIKSEDLYKNITKEFDKDGLEFSGGQKQKIAIVRSLYNNSDFVIMDEASSALDPIAENEINQLILNTMREKTVLIITHRLSTVKHVDKIIFMENGNIVEIGTHDDLMKSDGKYAEIYNIQAKQFQAQKDN